MPLPDHSRITIDPTICGGRPIVAGTRMLVSDMLQMLAGGAGEEEIVADFPYLKLKDVRACIACGAALVGRMTRTSAALGGSEGVLVSAHLELGAGLEGVVAVAGHRGPFNFTVCEVGGALPV